MHISDTIAESFRTGKPPKINVNNKHTRKRRQMFTNIEEQTGGDTEAAMDYSMSIIRDNMGRIKQYVLSKNETPVDDVAELAAQAYQLRCKEIDDIARTAGVGEGEALILLESDEAENDESNSGEADNYLGELAAPIGIVGNSVIGKKIASGEVDNFIDPALITGIVNTIGSKLDASELRRAAQNKPPGVAGTLGTGGKTAYNNLRKYLQDPAHAKEKQDILAGIITDISQLQGYGGASGNYPQQGGATTGILGQAAQNVADEMRRQQVRKMLPYIIGGVLVIVLIIIFVYRSQHKK